jgi:hypothetical protein
MIRGIPDECGDSHIVRLVTKTEGEDHDRD